MFQEFYEKGEYQKALEALRESPEGQGHTLATPSKSPLFLYQMGITHHALNQDGLAVAYLERALSLSPQDRQIAQALDVSRAGLVRTLGESRLDPGSNWVQKMAEDVPFDGAAVIAGILGAALFATQMGRFILRKRSPRDWLKSRVSWLAIAVVLFAFLFAGMDAAARREGAAIVVEAQIVKSGPGRSFLDLGGVEVGMKVRIVDPEPRQGWYKVRFSDDREGFVPASILLRLASG